MTKVHSTPPRFNFLCTQITAVPAWLNPPVDGNDGLWSLDHRIPVSRNFIVQEFHRLYIHAGLINFQICSGGPEAAAAGQQANYVYSVPSCRYKSRKPGAGLYQPPLIVLNRTLNFQPNGFAL